MGSRGPLRARRSSRLWVTPVPAGAKAATPRGEALPLRLPGDRAAEAQALAFARARLRHARGRFSHCRLVVVKLGFVGAPSLSEEAIEVLRLVCDDKPVDLEGLSGEALELLRGGYVSLKAGGGFSLEDRGIALGKLLGFL
jgi:hypothetical protein